MVSENPIERLSEIGLEEEMTFSDVGCSLGFFLFLAAFIVGKGELVYALDVNSEFIKYVSRKAEKKGMKNIRTIVTDAENPSLPLESVDFVFLHLVLYDVEDKPKATMDFGRILKADGKLVIDEDGVISLDFIRELVEESGFCFVKILRKTTQLFKQNQYNI